MYIRRSHRILIGIALVLAVAAGVYAWRGPAVVDEVQEAANALLKKASAPPPPTPEERQRSHARSIAYAKAQGKPAPTPLLQPRKCVQNSKVTYTDEPCPTGSQEQVVPDNLSVVPR
ncbi:MAG: hypothetical protein RSD57_00755 [Comamonas sp.]